MSHLKNLSSTKMQDGTELANIRHAFSPDFTRVSADYSRDGERRRRASLSGLGTIPRKVTKLETQIFLPGRIFSGLLLPIFSLQDCFLGAGRHVPSGQRLSSSAIPLLPRVARLSPIPATECCQEETGTAPGSSTPDQNSGRHNALAARLGNVRSWRDGSVVQFPSGRQFTRGHFQLPSLWEPSPHSARILIYVDKQRGLDIQVGKSPERIYPISSVHICCIGGATCIPKCYRCH